MHWYSPCRRRMMRHGPLAGGSKQKGADRWTTQDASFTAINAFRKWNGPVRLGGYRPLQELDTPSILDINTPNSRRARHRDPGLLRVLRKLADDCAGASGSADRAGWRFRAVHFQ